MLHEEEGVCVKNPVIRLRGGLLIVFHIIVVVCCRFKGKSFKNDDFVPSDSKLTVSSQVHIAATVHC